MPVSAGALTNADINFPFHFRTVLPFRRTMDYNVPQHSSPTPSQLSHALPFSDSAHSFPGTFPPITTLPHLPFRATLLYSRGCDDRFAAVMTYRRTVARHVLEPSPHRHIAKSPHPSSPDSLST